MGITVRPRGLLQHQGFNAGAKRYHLPVKNVTTLNNNLIEFKAYVFWMSFIMEVNRPVKPTDISLFCIVVEMIYANYFPDLTWS
jgi:hypothetical protein